MKTTKQRKKELLSQITNENLRLFLHCMNEEIKPLIMEILSEREDETFPVYYNGVHIDRKVRATGIPFEDYYNCNTKENKYHPIDGLFDRSINSVTFLTNPYIKYMKAKVI